MPGNYRAQVEGYRFYDVSTNQNGLGKYSCVSLATAAEVTTANAAGVPGNVGEICILTPVAGGLASRRILGVAQHSVLEGQDVEVAVSGVSWVMVNNAVALDSVLHAAANGTRTNLQTPFVDNEDMMVPLDPRLSVTFNLALADDTALPGANTVHYPLGYALKAGVAQYDVIPVELDLGYRR